MVKVGIVGGTGYTGIELLRLLIAHPDVHVECVTSRSEQGVPVHHAFPNLRGCLDVPFEAPTNDVLGRCDLVFFATPNGTAMRQAPDLLARGVRVVDLAADFRLRDADVWEQWYGEPHACPELLAEAVYGLPEINRDMIGTARLVANPGCYPTAVQLGFLPLLEQDAVDLSSLIADCKSGVSGAGRKASLASLFCEAGDSLKAYAVPGHRHLPEIRQGLAAVAKRVPGLVFVPHLTPLIRGIHATLYARLVDKDIDLQNLFESRYAHEPFVEVLESGSHPATGHVRGANRVHIACHRPQAGDTVVVLVVEDNLVKGAAGQAIQNMNLMMGLPETRGLQGVALMP